MTPQAYAVPFGTLSDGSPVREITLDNGRGVRLAVLDYGGIVREWWAPGRGGEAGNIVLGFGTLAEYEADTSYRGVLVGRYANRIANARFTLDGQEWELDRNDGAHHLHGGRFGFHKQLWQAHWQADIHSAVLELQRTSPDGEQGYPGRLEVTVRYEVHASGEVRLHCLATTDRATPVSISQHSYFNLAGQGDILEHELAIAAAAYLPVDDGLIPTGELRHVAGTPFDFRRSRAIGAGQPEGGYDHNFVLASGSGPCARLADRGSGRVMEIYTDAPGLQFYSGGYLDAPRYGALCLEPQHFPDAPNQPQFPDPYCVPGRPYRATLRYVFSCLP